MTASTLSAIASSYSDNPSAGNGPSVKRFTKEFVLSFVGKLVTIVQNYASTKAFVMLSSNETQFLTFAVTAPVSTPPNSDGESKKNVALT